MLPSWILPLLFRVQAPPAALPRTVSRQHGRAGGALGGGARLDKCWFPLKTRVLGWGVVRPLNELVSARTT